MPGYVYKGTQFDAKPKKGRKPGAYNPELCGSNKGIWRHRQNKEAQCPACLEKNNENRRNSYHKAKTSATPKKMRLDTIEKIQQARQLFATGLSQNEVHKQTGLAPATLRRHLPGHGWEKSQAGKKSAQLRKEGTSGLVQCGRQDALPPQNETGRP